MSQVCKPDAALLQRAQELLDAGGLRCFEVKDARRNVREASGKCVDAFNFVDRPFIRLTKEGVSEYRCGCPESRSGGMCVHCAALFLRAQQGTSILRTGPAAFRTRPGEDGVLRVPFSDGARVFRAPAPDGAEIERYSFAFPNYIAELSRSQYYEILGENTYANVVYESDCIDESGRDTGRSVANGVCFGFAADSGALNWAPDGVRPSDFRPGAGTPFALRKTDFHAEWNMELSHWIELLYLSQYHTVSKKAQRNERNSGGTDGLIRGLVEEIAALRRGERSSVIIGILNEGVGGHALFPYQVYELDSKVLAVALYDCNYPGHECYLFLLQDAFGRFINWGYCMGIDETGEPDFWEGDNPRCHLVYFPREEVYDVFKSRPAPLDDSVCGLFSSSPMSVKNAAGEEMLRIGPDGWTPCRDDVEVHPAFTMKPAPPFVSMPAGFYSITNNAPDGERCILRFTTLHRAAEIETDARELSLQVDDREQICCVNVMEIGRSYRLRLRASDPEDYEDVRLEGITGREGLRLAQIRHALYAEGVSEQTEQKLCIGENEMPLAMLKNRFPGAERERLFNLAPQEDKKEE